MGNLVLRQSGRGSLAAPGEQPVKEYRWASESGAQGMPHPDELRYFGYTEARRGDAVVRDPRYPGSVLFVREAR